jgi:hypothetical protein
VTVHDASVEFFLLAAALHRYVEWRAEQAREQPATDGAPIA